LGGPFHEKYNRVVRDGLLNKFLGVHGISLGC